MPAEWEPHEGTWMSWPHKEESWPGRFSRIPEAFGTIVRILSQHETVHINVNDAAMEARVKGLLTSRGVVMGRVRLHQIPTNDAWCRDHGPTFLSRDAHQDYPLAAVNWDFNSWGEKYPPYDLDDAVASRVSRLLGIPCFTPAIVLEGGSIDVNGRGSLLTTESCLLNPNRNPKLSRDDIERYLGDYLAATNILWLENGIAGDDTDGHVDDVARFVDDSTIVTVVSNDPSDLNYAPLQDNLARLSQTKDQDNQAFRIATLPTPKAMLLDGDLAPCSYANFYIANRVVIVPTFDCTEDSQALDCLQSLFPTREIHAVNCRDLIWGLGTIHCVTQQIPATPPSRRQSAESNMDV